MTNDDAAIGWKVRSVLHPTDLSVASEHAFAHALRIALAGKTRLYVLHVEPKDTEPVDWSAFPSVRRMLAAWGALEEDAAPSEVAERLGIHLVKAQVHNRDTVQAILQFLARHPSDLVVLSTHGREGMPRWLQGSVAEPVARQANAETLFIPVGARGFIDPDSGKVRLRQVLIPVDQSPRPESAVEAAWQLCGLLGAGEAILHLLYVGEPGDMPAVEVPRAAAGQIRRTSKVGAAVDTILAVANELDVDMIAMATAGRQGFLDAIRGSTTERVLRHAPCPVLAVPAA